MEIISIKTQDGSRFADRSTEHSDSHYGIPSWQGGSPQDLKGQTLTIILDGDLTIPRDEWESPEGFRAQVLFADEAWCVVYVAGYSDTLWALNCTAGTYHRLLYRRKGAEFMPIGDPQTLSDEFDADELPGEGATQDRIKLAIDLGQLHAEGTIADWSETEKSLGLGFA